MPLQVSFGNHPECGNHRIHTYYLAEHLVVHDRKGKYKYWHKRREEEPLMVWMFDTMREVERLAGEQFFWSCLRHCVWIESDDEDDESIGECSYPYWIVEIRDLEHTLVHKHWLLGFDEMDGDFLIERKSSEQTWFKVWESRETDRLERLCQAIKEHIRIRDFRIKRGTPR